MIDFYPGLIIQTTVPAKSLDNQLSKVMFTKIVVFLFKHYQNGKIFLLNVTMWQGRSQERACPTTPPTHKHTHTHKRAYFLALSLLSGVFVIFFHDLCTFLLLATFQISQLIIIYKSFCTSTYAIERMIQIMVYCCNTVYDKQI